jgi:nucleoside-diphosphate-sugar epimerase
MTLLSLQSKYNQLLMPSEKLVGDISKIDGDIIILGAGGKMGPALARLAKQAIDQSGIQKRIIAVARFSEQGLEEKLNQDGIKTIKADLLNDVDLTSLPEVKNVLYLAGTKFGTKGNEPYTWTMNTYLPGRVAQKFKSSNIVVFSTGNVYPFTSITSGGATEKNHPAPIGEYGQSCLGRERVFQYFSSLYHTPLLIYRLNYAIDVTYGVLLEIAKSVYQRRPIDLSMGFVNVIWQKDANEIALRSLLHTSVPATIVNVTGPVIYSVRKLAEEFGARLHSDPEFINEESETALLSNASACTKLFGAPQTPIEQMIDIIAEWVLQGGKTINKPTHFTEREGNF